MIYTLIISLLTEKPFYLLRPQSFPFQIVSEVMDIFVKFSDFVSRGGAFDSLFCPEGRVFVQNDCSRRRVFVPFKACPQGGWFWMKLIPALCEMMGGGGGESLHIKNNLRKSWRIWVFHLLNCT